MLELVEGVMCEKQKGSSPTLWLSKLSTQGRSLMASHSVRNEVVTGLVSVFSWQTEVTVTW